MKTHFFRSLFYSWNVYKISPHYGSFADKKIESVNAFQIYFKQLVARMGMCKYFYVVYITTGKNRRFTASGSIFFFYKNELHAIAFFYVLKILLHVFVINSIHFKMILQRASGALLDCFSSSIRVLICLKGKRIKNSRDGVENVQIYK